MVMKIALFTLSIACLCLCGCSKSRNDQENVQQQFDPLTAPIQEVQDFQEKIKAKIKSEEAPYNKNIQKITDNMQGATGEELKAYLKAVQDNVLLRDNVTADLKMQLPSNILMDKYNNLMRGYRNVAPYRVHLDIVLTIMGKTVPHRQKEMKRSCHEKRSEAVGQLGRRGTGSGG
jgi:PBP1b-binding outer membrane lipoprotein LpoB